MKAFYINKPYESCIKEIDIPEPGRDEVLIKVMACGICGTDIHLYKGDYSNPYPNIPGHEFSGIIEKTGTDVKQLHVGQRVACDPNIYCECCDNCRQNKQNYCLNYKGLGNQIPGAFEQYMVIKQSCVFDIGNLTFTTAAMTEPLSCVLHGHDKVRPEFGSKILILGCGPIGIFHLQVCKNDGAIFVAASDINMDRLVLAKRFGADYTIINDENADAEFRRIAPDGFDLIIDCTGVPEVIQRIIPYLAKGGRLHIFGVCPQNMRIEVNPFDIYNRELSIIGSNSLKKTFYQALVQLRTGKVKTEGLVSDKITLDELPKFLEQLSKGSSKLKTIVYPNGLVE